MNRRDVLRLMAPALVGVAGLGAGRPVLARTLNGVAPSILFIGDSIFANNNDGFLQGERRYLSHNGNGEIVWAWMSDPRVRFDVWLDSNGKVEAPAIKLEGANQGISGTKIYRLNNQVEIQRIRQCDPDIVIVGFGANDIPGGVSADQFLRVLNSFVGSMISEGRAVIVATVRPHVISGAKEEVYNYPLGDTKWEIHDLINASIRNEMPRKFGTMFRVWDTETPLSDPSAPRSGIFRPEVHRDGIHINDLGAFLSAQTLIPIIRELAPGPAFFDLGNQLHPLARPYRLLPTKGAEAAVTSAQTDTGYTLKIGGTRTKDERTFLWFHAGPWAGPLEGQPKAARLVVPVRIDSEGGLGAVTSFLSDNKGQNRVEGLRPGDRNDPKWPVRSFSGWIITPELQFTGTDISAGLSIIAKAGSATAMIEIKGNPFLL